ncbi:MAG: leucine-rich repeat protein [Lachnospiraceae bacterium]|nr:leucine-rich repeat protein [Lachnospiraceae bacterium]
MKRKLMRAVAGMLTFMLLFSGVSSAVPAYAKNDKKAEVETATKQGSVLTVTQDMVGKNGKVTITGEWDLIVVPKEIDASHVVFENAKAGKVEIESGINSKIDMKSGEFGSVAVVSAKLEEVTVADVIDMIRKTGDSAGAVKKYEDAQAKNEKIMNTRPTLETGKDAKVGEVSVSGNVKVDFRNGKVDGVKVDADGSQKQMKVDIANYNGNFTVKQKDREDGKWMTTHVKLKNTQIGNLSMEGEGNGNIILTGQKSEVKDVKVDKAPVISLNVQAEKVEIGKDSTNVKLTVLAKIESLQVSGNGASLEVGSCGSVEDATVEGNNVSISGDGILKKVDITGEGAYISTNGTSVTGKNNYVPPVLKPVGGIRDLGGLHIVIGDWYSTTPEVAVTEEQLAQEKYRQEMMEKYNFTVEQKFIANWDDFPDVFRTSVSLGTPAANIFMMEQGFLEGNRDYFYDLSKLHEFDFDAEKWNEDVKELMTWKDGIYGMSADEKEARGGVFINMDLYEQAIENAGLSMEDYDPFILQENGEWTWSKFEEICGILVENLNQDWDGTTNDKIYALTSQNVFTLSELVYSTDTELVGYDEAKGEYVNNLADPNVEKAYDFATGLIEKGYDLMEPDRSNGEYGAWNWFAERFYEEKAVMQFGETYYMTVGTADYSSGQAVVTKYNDMDANIAFLCCPKPDEGDGSDSYHTYFADNVAVIPACYDAKTAADIAFAYNLWTNPAPGYEEEREDEWKERYVHHDWDERSTDETLSIFYNEATIANTYINFLENLEQFTMEDEYFEIDGTLYYRWQFHRNEEGEYELGYLLDEIMPYWDETIRVANIKKKMYMPTARPDATFDYDASPYKVEVNPDGTLRLKKHKDPGSQGSEIVIPEELFGRKVVEIAPNAFRGRDITSVVIPEGVTKISPYAFGEDYALVTVTTPDSLTTIGDNAFWRCTSLQNMNLTENVTSIGEYAFSECWTEGESNLLITTMEGSYADTFAQEHNIPVQYEDQISEFEYIRFTTEWGEEIAITGYVSLAETVRIPAYIEGLPVTVVSGGAFKDCTDFTKVVLPNTLAEIKEEAFAGCTGLTELILPEYVWGIQARAFEGCTGLTNVVLSRTLLNIEEEAFAGCTGLTKIDLPEEISWINRRAFGDCINLEEIYVPNNANLNWDTSLFNGCDIEKLTVVTDHSDMAYFAQENGITVKSPNE